MVGGRRRVLEEPGPNYCHKPAEGKKDSVKKTSSPAVQGRGRGLGSSSVETIQRPVLAESKTWFPTQLAVQSSGEFTCIVNLAQSRERESLVFIYNFKSPFPSPSQSPPFPASLQVMANNSKMAQQVMLSQRFYCRQIKYNFRRQKVLFSCGFMSPFWYSKIFKANKIFPTFLFFFFSSQYPFF